MKTIKGQVRSIELPGKRQIETEPVDGGGGVSVNLRAYGARVAGMALTPALAQTLIDHMTAALRESQQ